MLDSLIAFYRDVTGKMLDVSYVFTLMWILAFRNEYQNLQNCQMVDKHFCYCDPAVSCLYNLFF